tara:strand:+ start:268 stop:438 length:171 start_codon:yes stop_codon:yes gene_type:complete
VETFYAAIDPDGGWDRGELIANKDVVFTITLLFLMNLFTISWKQRRALPQRISEIH